jgi:hypothetical protein
MEMETEFKRYYEWRIRPLETPEFCRWFETWYGRESLFDGLPTSSDLYLQERNFALVGWLAGRLENSHTMTQDEFVKAALPMPSNDIPEDI